ncbi:hypothetical protein [Amycolatopsis jiangsuensis]|uniref:NAD(P)-dependent dehydrogenase (Short-subunit alcohol dehydrogenase family) n=1 Tax=Amycolatopsis jiangsuensis TaxID=1181879 RepID=A0A840J2H4_9PSEU|nr:hypothetical protein [Amycolatopsis jiangsuensis]MBB4688250.1 NAD(P)-dependent dehydrogenase (short-subunit alcohol dehydrogenase family) [Amycolatopsis jiangsuensis]
MTEPGNHVHISGDSNGPMIFGGVVHGNVTGGTGGGETETAAELRRLVAELLALVRAADLAKQEVIADNLEELADAAGSEVAAAVPISRWEKVKKLLSGAAEFAGLTVRISEQVSKLWPS